MRGQVEAIFEKLSSLLAEAGSDLGHLVKAMYYVTDEPTTTALGQLRARYYDPKRPPVPPRQPSLPSAPQDGRSHWT